MQIYIGGILLPVNPESIKLSDTQHIEVVDIINLGQVPIISHSDLKTIEFESFVPGRFGDGNYKREGYTSPSAFISSIRAYKESGLPVRVLIGGGFRSAVNGLFVIQTFDVSTEPGYEQDVKYAIKLLQYRAMRPRKVEIKEKKAVVKATPKNRPNAPTPREEVLIVPLNMTKVKKRHTVISGDTLWGIAQKTYGDGSRYREIFEANKDKIKNPDLIYPGQELVIP